MAMGYGDVYKGESAEQTAQRMKADELRTAAELIVNRWSHPEYRGTEVSNAALLLARDWLAKNTKQDMDSALTEIGRLLTRPNCLLSGAGRGDCRHAIGVNSDTDEYGKPKGWCWACWRKNQIDRLDAEVERLRTSLEKIAEPYSGSHGEWNYDRARQIAGFLDDLSRFP